MDTAVAVATGTSTPRRPSSTATSGSFGDQQRLIDAQPVFGALDTVFTDVRSRTEYR